MPGELSDDHVLVETPAEASALYNRGYFGTPRSGGALELDLLEAVYLVEADRLEVRREGRRVSARDLFRAAGAARASSTRWKLGRSTRPASSARWSVAGCS